MEIMVILFVILFIPASMMWLRGVKALGRGVTTAAKNPEQTIRWIKFFVDISRR